MTAIVWTATMWLGGAAAADPDGPQDEVTQPAQPAQPSRPGGVEKPADDAVTGWRPVRPELDVAEVIGIRPDRVKRLAHRGSGKLWAVPIVPIGPTEFELPGGALHSHPALRVARRIWVNVANYGSNEPDVRVLLQYAEALDRADGGNLESAQQVLRELVERNLGFGLAQVRYEELLAQVHAARARRDRLLGGDARRLLEMADDYVAQNDVTELEALAGRLAEAIGGFHASAGFVDAELARAHAAEAGRYLFEVIADDAPRFTFPQAAQALREGLERWLEDHGGVRRFEDGLQPLAADSPARFGLHRAWLGRFARSGGHDPGLALEAATLRVVETRLDVHAAATSGRTEVAGLLGRHPRVREGRLELVLDAFLGRLRHFWDVVVPGFVAWRQRRSEVVAEARAAMRLEELAPRVMSAFVRNQLINDVYLPLVGDNLAKQIGAAGPGQRTDLMGLLLLISPPGYGKTTLMEYVASRLGITFVKVNGPALGHEVTSLDPVEAPSATARQEVERINFAFELGNNVLLYLDDIQHCSPELLQKFISLCDAQRRIEGVYRGRSRTYDLRGKKFAVVMAGNPYTGTFRVPDMLANRADIYNLGEILGGQARKFALSFVENALTSNPVLAPLATRSMDDVYRLVRRAEGEEIASSELSHDYSAVELSEIGAVLAHVLQCRDVLLKVNAAYVASAAMEDAYREEPRFLLQGSYRTMNKLAEKVVPAMNAEEVEALIDDHYRGEAQTLTTGAEANLLKLAALRGRQTEAQAARWAVIKAELRRRRRLGGADDDPATRITSVLTSMLEALQGLSDITLPAPTVAVEVASPAPTVDLSALADELRGLRDVLGQPPAAAADGPSRDTLVRHVVFVIELLTTRMFEAARRRLPEDGHEAFVDELRREVAAAVGDLAPNK